MQTLGLNLAKCERDENNIVGGGVGGKWKRIWEHAVPGSNEESDGADRAFDEDWQLEFIDYAHQTSIAVSCCHSK